MRRLRAAALLALPFLALPPAAPAQEEGGPPAAREEEGGFLSGLFGGGADEAPLVEDDEGFLTRFIEERLSATARSVDIQGFAGALSSRATIDLLTIADGEGVWLRAEDLALQWDRSELLGGRIAIEELAAGSIEVLRPPVPDPEIPRPEATPFRLPDLPVSLEIGRISSERIVLGEPLLGEELVLTLDGAVNLERGEGAATIEARIVEGSQGSLSFAGGYSNETRVLSVALDLEEAEGGLAARALRIPGLPSIALRVEGTAPIDDYEATLDIASDGEPRVAGTFALKTTEEPGEGAMVERAFGLDVRGDVTTLLAPAAARFLGSDVVLRTKGIRRSDGSLVLTSLGIEGEAVSLTGQAEITPEGWPARLDLGGRIGVEAGTPVPLPLAAGTTVRGVALDVAYDRERGESWTGTFEVEALERPGLSVAALALEGGGTIRPATAEAAGRFSADLAYEARGLAFDDASLGEALGADLSGGIDLVRIEDGGPLRVSRLTLSGPGIEAQAEGTIGGPDAGFLTQSSILLQAEDLARFAALTGLDLGGAADLTIVSAVRPLDRIFDLALSGTTRDLALGVEPLDPLLAGAGEVTLSAARDEAGLRVSTLSVATGALSATGEADLTSGASRARFDLDIADLGLSFPALAGPGAVSGSFDRDGTGAGTLDARATLPGASVALEAGIGPSARTRTGRRVPGPVTFTARAAIEELSDYREMIGAFAPDLTLAPSGALDLTLSGTTELDADLFDVTIDGRTRDLALGRPAFDAAFAGEGRLAGRLIRTGFDALRVQDLAIDTPLLDGTLTADLGEGTGSATLDLRLADVAPVLGGLSGPGEVSGTAARAADGSTGLDLALTLPTGTARVDGTLAAPAGGSAFTGEIAADFADLAPLGRLLGRDLAGGARGTASGTLRPDLSSLDLAFDLATRDLALGLPQLDPLLAGEGTVSGRAARDGDDLRLEEVRIETDLLSGTVTAAIEDGTGSADLDLALADVAPVLGGVEGPGTVTGTARQNGDGTTELDLRAALPTGEATVEGTLAGPEDGYAFTGDLAADFEDIGPLGRLLGRDLAGGVDATATGTVRPDLALLDLAFEARTSDLVTGIPAVDALLQGDGTLAGRAARTGPTSLRVDGLALRTDLLSGTVTARFEDGEGSAELDLSLPDVAPLLGGLSGPGRVTGTATGAGGGLVDLDLEATLPTGTASVDGALDLADGNAFAGDLAADFSDLAPLGPLLGRDLGGALAGTASGTLRPDLSALDLAFDVSTRDLRLGLPLLDPLLAGPGAFAGTVARSGEGDLALDIDADTPQLRGAAEGTFGQGSGEGRFDLALSDLGLIAPGFSGAATAVGVASRAADGSVAIDALATGPGLRADIDATLAPPEQGSEIAGSAAVSLADLSLLSPFAGRPLSGGFDGTVSGTALPSLARFDLALEGTARDPGLGIPALDRLLAGSGAVAARLARAEGAPLTVESLSADFPNLDLTASGDARALAFEATLADAALYAPAFPGAVSATGTATLGAGGATVDAQLTGPGGLSTRVTGPLGAVTDLRLVGQGPLALFNRILDPRRLEGAATFDLGLSGPSLAALAGTVTTRGASLADPTLGEAVRNIAGTATLSGGAATLALEGDLATGGRLAVTGPIGIEPPFDADLVVVGTGLVIRDPALYEAFGNARLTVTGSLAGGALIAGVADLDRVEGRVPASGVGALGPVPRVFHIEPSLPVVETLRRAGLSPSGEQIAPDTGEARGGGTPYGLDILLRAPARVFVRGRGLDAELGGELRLTGTTTEVVPLGQFSLIRGRLDILGQRFDLSEGSGTLQGDFNPFIRVVARTEARTGTEIAVVVEGPLASPTVSFESTPELPEDEVLAQLLFGVDIESITPLQAIRLASAVATLAGEGTGLIDELRGGIGLADFDVTTTESGNIALRLGQYVAENVYTDVVVSPEETEATINLDLSPDLTVRAGVSTRGDTTLGIFFERDY